MPRRHGFDSRSSRVITRSKLCTFTYALADQAIHPLGVSKLAPVIYRGQSRLRLWEYRIHVVALEALKIDRWC